MRKLMAKNGTYAGMFEMQAASYRLTSRTVRERRSNRLRKAT